MLQVKDAVQESLKAFGDVFASVEDLRLEEVSLDDDLKTWSVTFSFKNPDYKSPERTGAVSPVIGWRMTPEVALRSYKTVRLRASDGVFLGIRNEWLDK